MWGLALQSGGEFASSDATAAKRDGASPGCKDTSEFHWQPTSRSTTNSIIRAHLYCRNTIKQRRAALAERRELAAQWLSSTNFAGPIPVSLTEPLEQRSFACLRHLREDDTSDHRPFNE